MSDSRIVRAALLQASWTGDKESMIEKHIDYTRQAADQGAQIMCYQEPILWSLFLPGAGSAVLRLHRGNPRRTDHATLPPTGG